MSDTKNNSAAAVGELLPLPSGLGVDAEALLRMGESQALHPPITNPDGSITHFHGRDTHRVNVNALNPILPSFVTAAEVVIEPISFIDYIRTFKSPTAICKASLGGNQIVAYLDYHGAAQTGVAVGAVPNRLQHTVTLMCPFDRDYAKWRKAFNGGKFDQRELAEFIEDMIHTISEPAAADLLEAVADLNIDRQVRFKSVRNERNGNLSIAYEEMDAASPGQGTISLPEHIVIVLPIFQGAVAVQLKVRLRYRLDKGAIVFLMSVPGLDNEERIAFRSIGEKVREDTNTPVFYVQ